MLFHDGLVPDMTQLQTDINFLLPFPLVILFDTFTIHLIDSRSCHDLHRDV